MTRAEYEAKYGKAPTVSTSTLNTTPAPIRMTRAEYDQIYGNKPMTAGQDFAGDVALTGQRQQDIVNQGADTQNRIKERMQSGEVSTSKGLFQRFGSGLGTVSKLVSEGARGAVKMALPEQTEQKVGQFFNDYTGALASRVKEDYDQLKTSTDERDVALANKIDESMNLYQTDETFRTDVDAAGGILTAVSTALGMRTPSPDLKAPNLPELKNKIITTRETFAASKADAETQTIADKLFDIENSYVKTRKANARQKDEGSESRLRVAQSNVLADSVDGNGVIITLGKNGAYEQYKAATIGDSESVVRDILKQEGKTIKAKDIEAELKYAVSSSGVEGADLVEALNGVERELQGLVMRADLDGNVPLDKLQDFKTSQYERIDFNESKSNQIYRKALARAYKEMIEETSDADIKEINSELGKYYEDLARIKALDGKRVEGGRIGRAIAKSGGFVVGAGLGSVGGGLGSALGAAAGAKFADTLKSAAMKRALRGTDRDIPVNEVLAGAKLRIADKPITIPSKDLNPQSEATLFKINQNVIQQEKAIKSQDWNTVVALKQVYGLLIERLDNQLSDANISYTNQPKTAPNSSSILDRVKQFKESVKSDPLADFKEGRPNKQGGYIKNPLAKDNQDVSSVNSNTPTTLLEEAKKYKSAEEFVAAIRKQSDNAGGQGVRESKLPEVYKTVKVTPENAPTGSIDFLDVKNVTAPRIQGDLKLFEPHPNFKSSIKAASFDKGKTNFIFMKPGADPAKLQVRQKYEFAPGKWNTKDYYLTNDGGKSWFQLEPVDDVNWLEAGKISNEELSKIWKQANQ